MEQPARPPSARQQDLLERSYRYVLEHGLSDLSLRPLAAAIGSSPRVLLFLFGSKEGLIKALIARSRQDELAFLARAREEYDERGDGGGGGPARVVRDTWRFLVDERNRPLLVLWTEAYARSLAEPDGPWSGFARQTVDDWLGLLAASQPARRRDGAAAAEHTLALAVLRGVMIDLLATGDRARGDAAVERYLGLVEYEDEHRAGGG
jgi:AcrR family transcriptional regulator